MKRSFSAIIILCVVALFSNCNKTKHLPVQELDVDTAVTSPFNYKPGSYWIYTDTMSGRTDSFYVRANSFIQVGASDVINDYHKIFIAEHNIDGTNAADSALWVWDFEGYSINVDYYYGVDILGWKTDVSYSPLFFSPFVVGPIITTADTASITAILPVDTISHIPMSEVAVIHQYAADTAVGKTSTTFDDVFYVNDTLGMVQMSLNHPLQGINRFWKLKRYSIVR